MKGNIGRAAVAAATVLTSCAAPMPVLNPPAPAAQVLARQYREGETSGYRMRAASQAAERAISYTVDVRGIVKRDFFGTFYDELAWSDLQVNGRPIATTPGAATFRARLSLDPAWRPEPPDLGSADPALAGPILDFANFYADLSLATRRAALAKAGDHTRLAHNRPSSWADGRDVLLGEDAVDFDVALEALDDRHAVARVRHVPPPVPMIRLPADWMREPVTTTSPNNWAQVRREPDGSYAASVGAETVDVRLTVERPSGKLSAATLDDFVEVLERSCTDAALTRCGAPVRYPILRHVELEPLPPA